MPSAKQTRYIDSGRRLGIRLRLARLRPLFPRLPLLLILLALPLILAACSGYDNIRNAANEIRLDGGINFPTQVPYTGTVLLPVTAPSPIPDQQAIPGTVMDPCEGAEWWQAGIYHALGDGIKALTKNTMMGGFSVFSTAIGDGAIPVEDNVVMWMTTLAAGVVTGLWPLALLWAVLRSGMGRITGGSGGEGILKNIGRIGFVIFLATPQAGDSGPPIAYLMAIPMIICNAVFRVLIQAAISGWVNLTAYSGIFNIDGTCNGTGLLLLALLAIVIAVLLFLMAVVLWIRTGALYLNFAVAPFVLAGWMFDVDELRSQMGQFLSRYNTLVFGIVPVGVGFVLMNGFVLAPTSDVGESARHLIMATVCIFLMVMLLQRSLSGTTMMVLNRVRGTQRNWRQARGWARGVDARRASGREREEQARLMAPLATAAMPIARDTSRDRRFERAARANLFNTRDVNNAGRATTPMPSVLAEQPPIQTPTRQFPGVPTTATMPTMPNAATLPTDSSNHGVSVPGYSPTAPTVRNLPTNTTSASGAGTVVAFGGATTNAVLPAVKRNTASNIPAPSTVQLPNLPTPPAPASRPTMPQPSSPTLTFAPLLPSSWDESGYIPQSLATVNLPQSVATANLPTNQPSIVSNPPSKGDDDLTPLAVIYAPQVQPRQPLPPLPADVQATPLPLPTPELVPTAAQPPTGVSQQAQANQSSTGQQQLSAQTQALANALQANIDRQAAQGVALTVADSPIAPLETRQRSGRATNTTTLSPDLTTTTRPNIFSLPPINVATAATPPPPLPVADLPVASLNEQVPATPRRKLPSRAQLRAQAAEEVK